MRKPIIAANWKMNKSIGEAVAFVEQLKPLLGAGGAEAVICAPFTALAALNEALEGSGVALGAQNLYHEVSGAFTGEISPLMLKDVGVRYVIVGHSERRTLFGETDELIAKKVATAFQHGLTPILCVGETLAEREADETRKVVETQTEAALQGLTAEQVASLVIAYEPVWAIGTGKTSTAEDANQVCGWIRAKVAALAGQAAADKVRIQYGGSVKPANIRQFLEQPEIDGALVGGASLEAASFAALLQA